MMRLGTPEDRAKLLHDAFDATLQNAKCHADAEKPRIAVGPIPAQGIDRDPAGLFTLDRAHQSPSRRTFFPINFDADIDRRTPEIFLGGMP